MAKLPVLIVSGAVTILSSVATAATLECDMLEISGDGTMQMSGKALFHGTKLLTDISYDDGKGRISDILICDGPRGMTEHACTGLDEDEWSIHAEIVGGFEDPRLIVMGAASLLDGDLQLMVSAYELSSCQRVGE